MQARPMASCDVCLSVCLSVLFVNSVETNKHIFKTFSPPGSHTILVFPMKRHWNIPTGTPLRKASNAGGVGKNCNCESVHGFIVCCERFRVHIWLHHVVWTVLRAKCNTFQLWRTMASWRHKSLVSDKIYWWREKTTKFMTRSLNITPKTTEQQINCMQWQIWSLNNILIKDCARGIIYWWSVLTDRKHCAASLQKQSYLLPTAI